ncbi:non-ribosomal peptide synthetase/type I polyketide synthase [Polyangium jinanense]|uniref:Amino acid adenylation domain-containing protein n=1 Tax=Polyangium jinanense TaxID=2829994 RepID=A0A9X3X3R3_9BACT|nr:non-ribosomal peptide synthetase/type I polyketide synthase [Polyangium jinanense]MDC3955568.1 amino acid adenylation domain-containing protein [Polyangium jinanense]MDC3982210.1 amino acid adenylation domain-containing protein [Polyangium jinanense]
MDDKASDGEELSPLQRALLGLRKARAKIDALERSRSEPIAVIGMACRFPGGANTPEAFFDLLDAGIDAVGEVPAGRFRVDSSEDGAEDAAARAMRWGAFLKDDVSLFDTSFFNISPREAQALDPQQRLLLELAWEALENAAQVPEHLGGSRTGVFLGIMNTDYASLCMQLPPDAQDMYVATGNGHCFPAGRLSFALGLVGPSFVVDTACSSSLVALHLAVRSLRSGECSLALAGGVNLMLTPFASRASAKLGALSPDGKCRSFDASANGFVRGEGGAVVVLKRLSDAERDRDPILAVIRGSAVNQDGRSTGLTTPNVLSQEALIRQALEDARIGPERIGYVETHGTGTPLGDPIEFEALRAVYGKPREDGSPLVLGAVKTNIGHLEAGAGVAGLVKAILCLGRGTIPKNLHFETLNPRISTQGTPFVLPRTALPWKAENDLRVAAVSSFGMSGTNAHVILEEAPRKEGAGTAPQARSCFVLPISGKSPEALTTLAGAHAEHLAKTSADIADIVYSASARRGHHEERLAVVGRNKEEMATALASFSRGDMPEKAWRGKAPSVPPKVAFVFPGQGSQWAGMGRRLMQEEPVFRRAMEECDALFRQEMGLSVIEEISRPAEVSRIGDTLVTQPALFAIESALASLLESWGITPDIVIGHSVGELVAARVAGILELNEAVRLCARRARVMQSATGHGKMVLCATTVAEAEEAIAGLSDRVGIAAINHSKSVVLSGDVAAMGEVTARLEARGIHCRPLRTNVAFHSPQMEPLRAELLRELGQVAARRGAIPMISTVKGEVTPGERMDAAYWGDNLRNTVQFAPAVTAALAAHARLFVEVGPHPTLSLDITQILESSKISGASVSTLRRGEDDHERILSALASLYTQGCRVSWAQVYSAGGSVVSLPNHPFTRARHWLPTVDGGAPTKRSGHPLVGEPIASAARPEELVFETRVDVGSTPWLADHRVMGDIVFPAAAYVEMALAGGSARGEKDACAIERLEIEAPLVLTEGEGCTLQLVLTSEGPSERSFLIASRAREGAAWVVHARGKLLRVTKRQHERTSGEAIARRLNSSGGVSPEDHYSRVAAAGIQYGPAFQGLKEIVTVEGEVLGRVKLPEGMLDARYRVHPALLDACFQILGGLFGEASGEQLYLPVGIERIELEGRPGREVWVSGRLRGAARAGDEERVVDLSIESSDGRKIADIVGFRVRRMPGAERRDELEQCLMDVAWRPSEMDDQPRSPTGTWMVFADDGGTADALLGALSTTAERCIRIGKALAYESTGADSYRINPENEDDYRRVIHDALGDRGQCHGVVHLFSLDEDRPLDPAVDLTLALSRASVSATNVVKALAHRNAEHAPRLFLVTRGAQAVLEGEHVSLSQAPLWGVGRTIVLEHPDLRCTCIDLDIAGRDDDATSLSRALAQCGQEHQVAMRGARRHVARIVHGRFDAPGDPPSGRAHVLAKGRPFRLESEKPGYLENLALHASRRMPPGHGEVEIEVEAAALNFIDILKAMGTYPGLGPGRVALGGECSGRVVSVGEGVSGLEIGQEVIALAPAACASHVTTYARYVAPKPPSMSFAEAAAVPLVFMTAWYAIHDLGRARKGESILIHSATGGTGLAAIQVSRMLGLRIFATAGSESKRSHLRSMGIEHVMDSRSLSFAEEILRVTEGRGVDLVLNSLTGDALVKSLEVLASYGRFLEIGKRDIYENRKIGLLPFRKAISYSAVDLAGMSAERPDLFASLLEDVTRHFVEGRFEPLPVTSFVASDAESAFRLMAQAKHMGKIVLSMKDAQARVFLPGSSRPISVGADGTYLITGGLGGLGLSLARWLVEKGARHLVLVGRKGPSGDAFEAIRAMEQAGARVECARADVSRREDVDRVFASIDARFPSLRGVVHAAAVLDDHSLLELGEAEFRGVFGPKACGAHHLHTATLERDLDFFVMYSSAASLFGSAGQANYAAANAFLDALAHERSRMGLPAMSIQWGAFSEVGMAAATERRKDHLGALGAMTLSPAEGLSLMEKLFAHPRPVVGVVRMDVERISQANHPALASGYFAEFLGGARSETGAPGAGGGLRERVRAARGDERRRLVEEYVVEQLSRVLRLDPSRFDEHAPLKELGVDSLMSLELRNRVNAGLGLDLGATILLTHPDIAAVCETILGKLGADAAGDASTALAAAPSRTEPTTEAWSPLSHNQRALWFLHRAAPGSTVYNVGSALRVRGSLDVNALKNAFHQVVMRHPVLRSTYTMHDGDVVRHVDPRGAVRFEDIDAASWTEEELSARLRAAAQKPIDLELGPALTVTIFRRAVDECVLFIDSHHIGLDLWSFAIVHEELWSLYTAGLTGKKANLPIVTHDYDDFVRWQSRMLESAEGEKHFAYWRDELRGDIEPLRLPADRPRPPVLSYRGSSHAFTFPKEVEERLRALARAEGTTLFAVLLAAFQVFLHRWSGQNDILVGSPAAGRSLAQWSSVVGYFVNPIVLRASFRDDPSFRAALGEIHRTVLSALEHQDYPFSHLVERLAVSRDPAYSPVFQAMFALEQSHRGSDEAALVLGEGGARVALGPLEGESIALEDRGAPVDLALLVADTGHGLSASLRYNTDIFDRGTIARFAMGISTLFAAIVEGPGRRVSEYPLLSPDEQRKLLVDWNDTDASFARGACLHEVFEEHAKAHPEVLAIVSGEERLSYHEVNRRANRLAHRLRRMGVGRDSTVGLCLPRSSALLVSIIAVLKAGGAYLPLDPSLPRERLAFMIEDASVRALVTASTHVQALSGSPVPAVLLDTDAGALEAESDADPENLTDPDRAAYVIYTSGSTGKPKGVLCHHIGITNLIAHFQRKATLAPGDAHSFWSSLSFDASVFEIFSAFLCAGTIHIPPEEVRLVPAAFMDWLRARDVRGAYIPPFMIDETLAALESGRGPTSLRRLMVGVEPIPERTLARIAEKTPGLRIVNSYGPTEAAVIACTYDIDASVGSDRPAPIGRPIQNMRAYVLDRRMQPAPIGVPGELHVAGIGVARGYVNRPELSVERFLTDPFSPHGTDRMYRTGDIARWRADGNLEFLGRSDHQVKVRGYRIELGEIESALARHPLLDEVAVIVRADQAGEKRIVAYTVLREGAQPIPASDLRTYLTRTLPDYMVPSIFVSLDAMPRTASDKIDRGALPDVDPGGADPHGTHVEPRDGVELDLIRVWEDVLSVPRVGIHDDFFTLGGHSLLAVSLMTAVERQFGLKLPIAALLQAPTPAALAQRIRDRSAPGPWSPAVTIQPRGRGRPFFFVHPIVGTVMVYVPLARLLGTDRPFYGLQASGLLDDLAPLNSVEALAERYVEAIRAIQPEGPYLLGGWSFGGLVAIEMAAQLVEQGQEVSFLAVLDTASPDTLQDEAPMNSLDTLLRMAEGLGGPIASAELDGLDAEQRVAHVFERIRALEIFPAELGVERLLTHIDAHLSAGLRYRPRLPCRMDLFRATESAGNSGQHTSHFGDAWRAYSSRPVECHDVPGTHYTLVREPHVTVLAERLRGCLNAVDPPQVGEGT